MSKTKIEWSDEVWNPTTGCTRVSAGCEHCYIERTPPMRVNRRFDGPHIGASTKGGVQLHPDRLDQPLHWRKPRRVFVNSMSDLFHPDVPDEFIEEVFVAMASAPRHTFQVLTKRPRRMAHLLSQSGTRNFIVNRTASNNVERARARGSLLNDHIPEWPVPNVWLGTSVENQEWADKRIPLLLETPAAVRFLSCEPLLGPIDLRLKALRGTPHEHDAPSDLHTRADRIDWVIVGGESGPGARPMHPDWARSLRDQCVAAGVPFFFKQWGEWAPATVEDDPNFAEGRAFNDPSGGRIAAVIRERSSKPFRSGTLRRLEPGDRTNRTAMLDTDTVAVRVGKKRAGRELDGRTWDEMPRV